MNVAILSDVHLTYANKDEAIKTLREAVNEIKEVDPDLVIVLGDLLGNVVSMGHDHGEEVEGLPELEEVRDIFDPLSCRKFFMRGNHDDHIDAGEWKRIFGNKPHERFKIEDQDFIFLDSADSGISGSRGQLGTSQLEFFDKALESSENPIVFLHHPMYYTDFSDTYWWDTYPERAICEDKKEANSLFDSEDVKAVFNGHIHELDHTEYQGTDHFTVPPFISLDKSGFAGSYTLLEINDDLEVKMKGPEGIKTWRI